MEEVSNFKLSADGRRIEKSKAMFDFEAALEFTKVFLLPLTCRQHGLRIDGIMLNASLADKGEYCRCGKFEIFDKESSDLFLKNAQRTDLKPLEYKEAHDDGTYTIVLV